MHIQIKSYQIEQFENTTLFCIKIYYMLDGKFVVSGYFSKYTAEVIFNKVFIEKFNKIEHSVFDDKMLTFKSVEDAKKVVDMLDSIMLMNKLEE